MTHAATIARDEAIIECLRAINAAIGDEAPTPQAFRIIDAVKSLRSDQPVRVPLAARRKGDGIAAPIDYLEQVQQAARAEWVKSHGGQHGNVVVTGPGTDATAGIETPLGRLRATTWRTRWRSGKIAWSTEYYLNDNPITLAEIKDAGLAQRPTTRNRSKNK